MRAVCAVWWLPLARACDQWIRSVSSVPPDPNPESSTHNRMHAFFPGHDSSRCIRLATHVGCYYWCCVDAIDYGER